MLLRDVQGGNNKDAGNGTVRLCNARLNFEHASIFNSEADSRLLPTQRGRNRRVIILLRQNVQRSKSPKRRNGARLRHQRGRGIRNERQTRI